MLHPLFALLFVFICMRHLLAIAVSTVYPANSVVYRPLQRAAAFLHCEFCTVWLLAFVYILHLCRRRTGSDLLCSCILKIGSAPNKSTPELLT